MAKSQSDLSPPISLRIPGDLLESIDRIAAACERPRSWVIVRALRHYAAAEGADVLAIAEGMEQIKRGDVHDMEDVLREMEAIIAADKAA